MRSGNIKYVVILSILLGLEALYLVKDRYLNFNPLNTTPETFESAVERKWKKWLEAEKNKPVKHTEPVKYKLERSFIENGQVWLYYIDSTIQHGIHSFPHHSSVRLNVYGALYAVYLPEEVCKALSAAQLALKKEYPYYSLVVFDGTRAAHVDSAVFDTCKKLAGQAGISWNSDNPHHYGSAVDVGIMDEKGILQSMGEGYNIFEEYGLKDPFKKKSLGPIQRELANRELLKRVMLTSGFRSSANNCWHFEFAASGATKNKFKRIP